MQVVYWKDVNVEMQDERFHEAKGYLSANLLEGTMNALARSVSMAFVLMVGVTVQAQKNPSARPVGMIEFSQVGLTLGMPQGSVTSRLAVANIILRKMPGSVDTWHVGCRPIGGPDSLNSCLGSVTFVKGKLVRVAKLWTGDALGAGDGAALAKGLYNLTVRFREEGFTRCSLSVRTNSYLGVDDQTTEITCGPKRIIVSGRTESDGSGTYSLSEVLQPEK